MTKLSPLCQTSRPFLKHLHNLVINGFYTRDLDADDFAFLEYVRHHGCANGSLPGAGAVLLEELEFWNGPYTIAPDVDRHLGKRPRPVMTAEQRAFRKARYSEWHARRVLRANERAIAETELERERCEWEKKNQKRKMRELLSDAEWDAAAPREAPFGVTVHRHHVPQWKLDEQHRAKSETRLRPLNVKMLKRERREKERQAELQRKEESMRERNEAIARSAAEAQEYIRREKIMAEARETIARTSQIQRPDPPALYPTDQLLYSAIHMLIRGTGTYVWTIDEIMRSINCHDEARVRACLDQMVRCGNVRQTNK
jgi:hypothetical protein